MLTSQFTETIKEAARDLKGAVKRAFMANVADDYLNGSARHAESTFGWDRVAVKKGQHEKRSGIICIDNHSAKGRKKTEEKLPGLEDDIHDLLEKNSQVDPKFRSPFQYSRISAKAVREALIKEKGYTNEELCSIRTISAILNRLGYSLKKTKNTTPIKKIPETDAIFDNVHEGNEDADNSPNSLRISVDAKAKVKIGNLSRRGKDRGQKANEADDHDTEVKATLTPIGIVEVVEGKLTIMFGQSYETSDLIADCIEKWWNNNKEYHSQVDELAINQDNGPSVGSSRTQFLKRMVAFSKQSGLIIRLLYYPPYHSKYNPIERCWGALENYWNGAILDTIHTAVEWASNMTWKGMNPTVELINGTYEKGVKVCRGEMKELQQYITRSTDLPKWDVVIKCS